MPIQYARERRLMLEFLLQWRQNAADCYLPHLAGRTRQLHLNVLTVVFLGHLSNKPASASTVANVLDIPRATAIRRLKDLRGWGLVEPATKAKFCIPLEVANSRKALEYFEKNKKMLVRIAKLISPN